MRFLSLICQFLFIFLRNNKCVFLNKEKLLSTNCEVKKIKIFKLNMSFY